MFDRVLELPRRSFFLFGPRATGKSTWLRQRLGDALRLDLLRNDVYLRLAAAPESLRELATALPKGAWIVLDEVQRVPALLDEVHALIEDHGYRFALTGSSARKLKRGKANLLAGRALVRSFFPLVHAEHGGHMPVDELLRFGTLPGVVSEADDRIDILDAYAGTYLREEIKEEALTRNISSYARFLKVAALANGQVTNLSGIARDSAVPRATVSGYFEILTDTLLGRFLPAWIAKARVKEVAHPKFYFFDPGVVRAIQGRLRDPLEADERGHLLETYLCHELHAHVSYRALGGEWSYWRSVSGPEVDFVWQRGRQLVAIECKASVRWRKEDDAGMLALRGQPGLGAAFGVYLGEHRLRRPWGMVLPLRDFLEELGADGVLPAK